MKSVAVIGAGPGGLVTAKTLLHVFPKRFDVTVFEKQGRVGGLWAVDPDIDCKTLNPHMKTNLSKYTVSFSDLSWSSVNITLPTQLRQDDGKNAQSSQVPLFPKAWHAGRYLETYRQRFIPERILRLNCEVIEVSPLDLDRDPKWKVRWRHEAQVESCIFDYVVICSGFCSSPLNTPKVKVQNSNDSGNTFSPRILHSSKVRSLSDLVDAEWKGEGDILVVGGTMSGVEAAASIALEISSRRHSPGWPIFGAPKVFHVIPRPFYILPRYIPQDNMNERPIFLPLDLCFYTLDRRPSSATSGAIGRMARGKAQTSHQYLRSKIGGDQSDLQTPSLVHSSLDESPYVAIATGVSYSEFVRSGHIVPWHGRLEEVKIASHTSAKSLKPAPLRAIIHQTEGDTTLDDIEGIVYATGYTPCTSLEILSEDVKRILEFDGEANRVPLILTDSQTYNRDLPGLAFVGLHEGTYWGTAETQARKITARWIGEESDDIASWTHEKALEKEEKETVRDLRHAINQRATDVPQLWNGDYVGLMEQTVVSLCAQRDDNEWGGRCGPVYPARYLDSSSDIAEAKATTYELRSIMNKAAGEGLFVGHAAFFALQGSWQISRELKSALVDSPSGSMLGTAVFEPRHATHPKFDAEYLYIENGDFRTTQGLSMKASRRYVYRYEESKDLISTWFVKEDGNTVDYLFLDLNVELDAGVSDRTSSWFFRSKHLCSPDTYDAKYRFNFRGSALDSVLIEYRVTGPKKDYTSTTSYYRL